MALPPGSTLGPYIITAPIGAGGMGEVYRARDPRLGRDVALKVLPSHLSSNRDTLARFEREARAAAALSHANIVSVYDIGRVESTAYVVLQLLEGNTLRELLASGPFEWRRAVSTTISLSEGLAAAHARGIVHRDLKPENVLVTTDGEVKILDFGLASSPPRPVDETAMVTREGTVLGTPGYMSPEQVRGEAATAASDIFSLGCVLYEMITGRRAFQRGTIVESFAAVLHDPAPSLDSGVAPIPAELQRVVRRCLEKDPVLRFQSAQDLAVTLRAIGTPDAAASLDSLAVLPFANSGGVETEYLSDGITETLINHFSRVPHLRVIPRSIVFRHKDSALGPRALGAALGARLLLTGRVMHRGERLSVQADLVDAPLEQQVWGERFNRTTADIFEVEDEIARGIADRLRVQLSREERQQIAHRHTEDSEAYRLYLKARFHWRRRTTADLELALEYSRQAIAQDPSNPQAHAGLAETHCLLVWYGLEAPNEGLRMAEAAASESVRLDRDLAEGHAALGFSRACQRDFVGGEAHFKEAIQADPGYYLSHDWYALTLAAMGRTQEAMEQMHRARQIDPLSPVIYHHSAWVYFLAHRFEDAFRISTQALDVDANYPFGHFWAGIAATELGRHELAVSHLERALVTFAHAPVGFAALGHAYGRAGRDVDARRTLDGLERASGVHVDAYHVALIRTGLGDDRAALEALRRAAAAGSVWHTFYLRCDPRMNRLRTLPDFARLLS